MRRKQARFFSLHDVNVNVFSIVSFSMSNFYFHQYFCCFWIIKAAFKASLCSLFVSDKVFQTCFDLPFSLPLLSYNVFLR